MSEAIAPALSTYQDDITFQKYGESEHQRHYLGPNWNEKDELVDRLRDYYSIPELLHYLKREVDGVRVHQKITLQFPDALVADSAIVVQLLQEGLGINTEDGQVVEAMDHNEKKDPHECKKTCETCSCSDDKSSNNNKQQVWILADTAYSACCIDEVAAGHVGSDLVVHFGDACLNAIQKLDSVYVFGKPYLDCEQIATKFRESYSSDEKVILMADAPYTRYLERLHAILKDEYQNVAYADIDLEKANKSKIIGFKSSSGPTKLRFGNRVIKGLDIDEDGLNESALFHITTPQPPHLLFLSTKFSSMTIYEPMDNSTNTGPFPSLMKRYRFMQMARSAGTIGILVNTLSLRNTTEVMKTVSAKIRNAGKKHYMFVVGKPNVAKLANFESIELWCILGCGQGGIVLDQSNEFYKPIITPYELEMALNPVVTWTGQWVTSFAELIEEKDKNDESHEEEDADEDQESERLEGEDEAPEFNPVTGKYVSTSRPLRQIKHLEIDSVSHGANEEGQLVKAFSKTIAIKGTVSTSATYLQNREWTGLGSDFTNDVDEEGALVEEGRGGVARGYDFDVAKH